MRLVTTRKFNTGIHMAFACRIFWIELRLGLAFSILLALVALCSKVIERPAKAETIATNPQTFLVAFAMEKNDFKRQTMVGDNLYLAIRSHGLMGTIKAEFLMQGDVQTAENMSTDFLSLTTALFVATSDSFYIHQFRRSIMLDISQAHAKLMADSCMQNGDVFLRERNTAAAKQTYERAFLLYGKNMDSLGIANCLMKMSLVHQNLSDLRTSKSLLEQSIHLNKRIGNREGEADAWGNMGIIHRMEGNADSATKCYQLALRYHVAVNNRWAIGIASRNIGLQMYWAGSYASAVQYFRSAIEIKKSQPDVAILANTYVNLAACFVELHDYDSALVYYELADSLLNELSDTSAIELQVEIGNVLLKLGRPVQAAKCYKMVIDQNLSLDIKYEALLRISECYILRNKNCKKSIRSLEQCADHYQEQDKRAFKIDALLWLAQARRQCHQDSLALAVLNSAEMDVSDRASPDLLRRVLEAKADIFEDLRLGKELTETRKQLMEVAPTDGAIFLLINQGRYRTAKNDTALAVSLLDSAITMAEQFSLQQILGIALDDKACLARQMGNESAALDLSCQALDIKKLCNDTSGISVSLNSIGNFYSKMDEPTKARSYYSEALYFARQTQNEEAEAKLLGNIATTLIEENCRTAVDLQLESLRILTTLNLQDQMQLAHVNLASAFGQCGDTERQCEHLHKALQIQTIKETSKGNALLLSIHGSCLLLECKYEAALAVGCEALRSSILEHSIDALENSVRVCAKASRKLGMTDTLQNVLEQATSFLEAAFSAEPKLIQSRKLRNALGRHFTNLIHMIASNPNPGDSVATMQKILELAIRSGGATSHAKRAQVISELHRTAAQIKRNIRELHDSLQRAQIPSNQQILSERLHFQTGRLYDVITRAKSTGIKNYNDHTATTRIPALSELARRLAESEIIVSYHIADDKLITLILTNNSQRFVTTDINHDSLHSQMLLYAQSMKAPSMELDTVAALYLSQKFLAPLRDKIDRITHSRQVPRLMIVRNPVFNVVPIETLPWRATEDAFTFLLEICAVSYINSINPTQTVSETTSSHFVDKRIALLAPFVPSHSTSATRKYRHLPGSAREVEMISAIVPQATVLIGSTATYQGLLSSLQKADYVHIATHTVFENQPIEFCAIALQDMEVTPEELCLLDCSAEMVTISGCKSATGNLLVGNAQIGFADAILQAGAKAVTLSLWNIDDQASAELTAKFYLGMRRGLATDMALRDAKICILKKGYGRDGFGSPLAWSNPYYWAPFIIFSQ